MGFSSSKSKIKPVYGTQVTGAYDTLNSVYKDQAPKIDQVSSAITDLVPSLADRYKTGDPTLNAAQGYVSETLAGKNLYSYTPDSYFQSVINGTDGSNTSLNDMIAQTNNSVANSVNAKLGTRGLTGGTVQSNVLARALADNETGLRYNDYTTQQARRDQAALTEAQRRDQAAQIALQQQQGAAGMAPGLAAAYSDLLNPLLNASNAVNMPLSAASGYASGVGGLLGQYTNTKGTTPWGSQLLGAASNAAGAYFGATGG
jgi:hypothetical protein